MVEQLRRLKLTTVNVVDLYFAKAFQNLPCIRRAKTLRAHMELNGSYRATRMDSKLVIRQKTESGKRGKSWLDKSASQTTQRSVLGPLLFITFIKRYR